MTYKARSLVLLGLTALIIQSSSAQNDPPMAPMKTNTEAPSPGSPEARQRAEALRRSVAGTVLNEQIDATWISEHELIYRQQLTLTDWQFVIADAKTGQKKPAFNHQKIAKALSLSSPQQLPLSGFVADQGQLFALLNQSSLVVLDRQSSTLTKLDPRRSSPLDLPAIPRRLSPRGQGHGLMIFLNQSKGPVTIYWLRSDGQRIKYAHLAAGAQHRQHSVGQHVWVVVDAAERDLGFYQAPTRPAVVRIDGQRHLPKSQTDDAMRGWKAQVYGSVVRLQSPTRQGRSAKFSLNQGARLTGFTTLSPNKRFLIAESRVPEQRHTVTMVESSPRDRLEPRVHRHQYLKPGDRIAQHRYLLYDLKRDQQVIIDEALFPNPYHIDELAWSSDSTSFSFCYNQRGHQVFRLIRVDTSTGKARAVISEEPESFFDWTNKRFIHRLKGRDEVIWSSERDGWNHLYLIDGQTGRVKRQITKGSWLVRAVDLVDEEAGTIRFRAMGMHPGQDPYHVHFGVVGIDSGDVKWLSRGDGTHKLWPSPSGQYFLTLYSRVDLAPVHELRDADGKLCVELTRADTKALKAKGWRAPERFVAKGRDGKTDIWGLILFPSWMKKGQRLPVIESIYAGPHGHHVPKRFATWRAQREISEAGFIVVRIDGMGTNWRSKAFHDVCAKNLADGGFPDRMAWMRAAAKKFPEMDLTRVGIYGGSAGGQNALRAMLAHGDFYKAAAADCGCHDNRMDKLWWNEMWMAWPVGEHYRQQSNVRQAHKLSGPLLLTVGELDRNVDPASTMQVVDALIRADKDFELIVFPGLGHGAGESAYGRRRRLDFFTRHLVGRRRSF